MEDTETSEDTTEEEEASLEDDASKLKKAPEEPLDRAERLNKEKEVLLEREQKLIDRKEKLFADAMVGGRASAGQTTKAETEEEKKKAGAKDFFKGTQLEKDIDKL